MRPNHNSTVAVLRLSDQDRNLQVLLLKCLPIPNRPEDEIFYKIPGGVGKNGEEPEDTARRELKEETGLKIPKKVKLNLVDVEMIGSHTKYGYYVLRQHCNGSIRKIPHNDRKTRFVGTEWVPIERALELIQPREENRSQHDLLSTLKASHEIFA